MYVFVGLLKPLQSVNELLASILIVIDSVISKVLGVIVT
jgi:hypothetical protein